MKLTQVSRSMNISNTRRSDQDAIWSEIEAKSNQMSVESSTRAMADTWY